MYTLHTIHIQPSHGVIQYIENRISEKMVGCIRYTKNAKHLINSILAYYIVSVHCTYSVHYVHRTQNLVAGLYSTHLKHRIDQIEYGWGEAEGSRRAAETTTSDYQYIDVHLG